MKQWDSTMEEDITSLVKDWLKQQGKTQKDLKKILNADSDRMPTLIENIKREYDFGGLPKLAALLCKIEEAWLSKEKKISYRYFWRFY